MRNLKRSRGILLACLLIAVVALTAVFTLNTFASEVTTEFTNVTMTLNDGTNIRFIGTLAEADRESATFTYTLSGKTYTAELSVDSEGNFTADVPVGAGEMAEPVTAKITVADGKEITAQTSVKAYAEYQLENDNTYIQSLVSEMLRYGEAAYQYVNDEASTLLDGLTLTEALTFPEAPVYTYIKDSTNTFKTIKLTLTDALRLTFTTADGTTYPQRVMISQFFDGITATSGEASVTASASLYANINKDAEEEGALVKALYNYALAVHTAIDDHHVIDASTLDEATNTLTYACKLCSASYATQVFAIDQFSGKSPIWGPIYTAGKLNMSTKVDTPNVGDTSYSVTCVDGKGTMVKDKTTTGYQVGRENNATAFSNTGLDNSSIPGYYIDGTNNKKMAFGFDLTMPEAGFSSSEDIPFFSISGRTGGKDGNFKYNISLRGKKIVAHTDDSVYTDVYEFAPGATHHVVMTYEFITVDGVSKLETKVFIDGVEKISYQNSTDATNQYFTTAGTRLFFRAYPEDFHATAVGTGAILDNMFYANDFTGFVAHEECTAATHKVNTADPTQHLAVCACGKVLAVVDHTLGDYTTVTPATCTAEGSETATCSLCGGTDTRAIPATGHTLDAGVFDPATNTITYTCEACEQSYSTTVLKMEQFSDSSYTWYGKYYYLAVATDATNTSNNGTNVRPVSNGNSAPGQLYFVKDAATYGYDTGSSRSKSGLYLLDINQYYTEGTDNTTAVLGFDLTMPENGFSSAAEGEPDLFFRLTGNAGNKSGVLDYNIALRGNKLIAATSGSSSAPDYIDVYTFAPGETRNVAVSQEFITVDSTVTLEIKVYIDGEEKISYQRVVSDVTTEYFAASGSRFYFDISAAGYHKTGVGTGVIIDNMYLADNFTPFAE